MHCCRCYRQHWVRTVVGATIAALGVHCWEVLKEGLGVHRFKCQEQHWVCTVVGATKQHRMQALQKKDWVCTVVGAIGSTGCALL